MSREEDFEGSFPAKTPCCSSSVMLLKPEGVIEVFRGWLNEGKPFLEILEVWSRHVSIVVIEMATSIMSTE